MITEANAGTVELSKAALIKTRVLAAMEHSGDSIPLAAAMLGWNQKKLERYLEKIGARKDATRPDGEAHNQVTSLHRPKAPEMVFDDVVETAKGVIQQLQRESDMLKKGLKGLNLADEGVDLLVACRAVANQSFKATFEILHGGMLKTFADLLVDSEKILKAKQSVTDALRDEMRFPFGSDVRQIVVQEESLRQGQVIEVVKAIVDANRMVHSSALVMAMNKRGATKAKAGKMAFGGAENQEET